MDRLDAPDIMPDAVSADFEPLTPTQSRIAVCCADMAASFRAIAAVSTRAALLLETNNGTVDDLVGLVQAYEQLQVQASERLTCLGAAVSSSGSA